MRRGHETRHRLNYIFIIILAYANRYLYPLLLLSILVWAKGTSNFMPAGISILVFSVYELIGYLCKWKHIFCSFQNAYHRKMTPDSIDWDLVSKTDAYLIPGIFALFGVILLLL